MQSDRAYKHRWFHKHVKHSEPLKNEYGSTRIRVGRLGKPLGCLVCRARGRETLFCSDCRAAALRGSCTCDLKVRLEGMKLEILLVESELECEIEWAAG